MELNREEREKESCIKRKEEVYKYKLQATK